ncbi:MAG: hypothetical protein AAF438_12375 [Pseudomonadota bacterium]
MRDMAEAMEANLETFNDDAHRGFVMNAVLSACHLIESNINEIYTESAEQNTERLGALGQGAIELMAGVWKRGVPSKASLTTLEKYELALDFSIHASFDRTDDRFAETQTLMRLGDALVVVDQNWVLSQGDARRCRLEREFFANKMQTRFAFQGPNSSPTLGSACARWAVTTALAFLDHFYEMIALMPPYEDVRSGL